MKEKVIYIISVIPALLLTAAALLVSPHTQPVLVSGSALIVLFTLRSLSDKTGICFLAVQCVISIAFAAFSQLWVAYIILCEMRFEKKESVRIFLPSAALLAVETLFYKNAFSYTLFYAIILMCISALLYAIERLALSYVDAKSRIAQAVSITAVNEMYEKKLNRELTVKNYLADRNARLEERESISRNIHNSVGHSITAAIMTLDAADMLFDTAPQRAREKLNTANERIRESLSSIRRAVRVLDDENKDVPISDLIDEIISIADSFVMDTEIKVKTDFSAADRSALLPSVHTQFLCGAVSELMTNGVRHGNADMFYISLFSDSRHIKFVVSDNGKSDFSEENKQARIANGFGLKKLVSYADRCGGRVQLDNENGFKAQITLPVEKECSNE